MKKLLKPKYIIPAAVALVLIAAIIIGVVFVNDYYPASDRALAAMTSTEDDSVSVTVTELFDNATVFSSETPAAALILYPGGKVDHAAYAPLAQSLARRGILCVLMEMPLRLAVLDTNAADGVIEAVEKQYPTVTSWYIGGHSLGGTIASGYAAKHVDEYVGVVLLGSYTSSDLSETNLRILSIIGSEDGVINRDRYEESKGKLPDGFVEEIIDGGNHAGFGDYGAQDGDGASTLSDGEQIEIASHLIAMFLYARA